MPEALRATSSISACPLPAHALLHECVADGGYADCYMGEIAGSVSQAQFVEAFYTTDVFSVERWILRWALALPSTDAQARQLATGAIDTFAAWKVQRRRSDQLLLADVGGRTRSWLAVVPDGDAAAARTLLYFGSAVMPRKGAGRDGGMGWVFLALLGFHKLYSRILLAAARRRLVLQQPFS